jgi:hypothetical protein
VPDPRFWDRDPDGVFEVRRYADPEGGWMKSWENGFYDPITQINLVRYHYRRSDGRLQTLNVPLRMFYPQELLGLVRLGGFRVLRQCGDFRGGDLIPGCAKLVLVLEAA